VHISKSIANPEAPDMLPLHLQSMLSWVFINKKLTIYLEEHLPLLVLIWLAQLDVSFQPTPRPKNAVEVNRNYLQEPKYLDADTHVMKVFWKVG
jgi:hypothetical protein